MATDEFLTWGENIQGVDEGDGWVRVELPQRPKASEPWKVVYPSVNVRSDRSIDADQIGLKSRGEVVHGVEEGGWIKLDSGGYMQIQVGKEPLLQRLQAGTFEIGCRVHATRDLSIGGGLCVKSGTGGLVVKPTPEAREAGQISVKWDAYEEKFKFFSSLRVFPGDLKKAESGSEKPTVPALLEEYQTRSVTSFTDLKVEEFVFSRSVWDVAIFVGQPALGMCSSVLVLCGILIAMVVMILFGGIVLDDIADTDAYNLMARQQLQDWRSVWNSTGLVAQVCSEDSSVTISATQMRMAGDLHAFLPRSDSGSRSFRDYLFSGPTLTVLALLFWYARVLNEFVGVSRFLRALCLMCTGDTVLESEGNRFRLRSLSSSRVTFGISLVVVRLGLSCFLAGAGTVYIVHTVSMQNLLLNYIVLAFVLDIDKLLFESLAPVQARSLIKNLRSVPLLSLETSGELDATASVVHVSLITALVLVGVCMLKPFVDDLHEAQKILCL